MQLGPFLESQNLSQTEFAGQVGATAEAVRLWVKGDRIPASKFMAAIREATSGTVQPNDFYDLPADPAPIPAE